METSGIEQSRLGYNETDLSKGTVFHSINQETEIRHSLRSTMPLHG